MTAGITAAAIGSTVGPLALDIDQATRIGNCGAPGGSCTATSDVATTTTTGGYLPYTFLWEFVSGDSFTITTPTADNTTFSLNNPVAGDPSFNGVYRCTATDGNSATSSDTVSVTLTFTDTT